MKSRTVDAVPTFRLLQLVCLALGGLAISNVTRAADIEFDRQVRPILAEHCFACHGPDEKARKAKLRLDTKSGLLADSRSGDAIVAPGKSAKSELIHRLTTDDEAQQMPPPKGGKKLTAEQVRVLKAWVDQGANWSAHWAFVAPRRPELPKVNDPHWARNPIDAFILSRLEKEGLKPSPLAEKETLIRRASLDLTGLPPTPDEIDAFLKDTSSEAYEKVVDRLLASSRYGERQAMQWLDYARFADSNGFQTDTGRAMWPWRDWVIDAYNRNLPFDRFTVEQLAGDLLPNPTRSQVIATGFNRNHRLNGEGGIIGEEWRIESIIDRVETTGLTWLGLTLGCTRCHDHKYDPISQKEFYQLFAFFNNVPESGTLGGNRSGGNTDPVENAGSAEQEAQLARMKEMIREAERESARLAEGLPALIAAWEPEFRKTLDDRKAGWVPFVPKSVKSQGGATMTKQADESYLASGTNPAHDVYTISGSLSAGPFTGLRLECFTDPSLPGQSLGRYPNGNFVLSRVEAEITAPTLAEPVKVRFTKAAADYSQPGWEIAHTVGTDRAKGWAVDGPTKKEPRKAMFLADATTAVPANATLTVRLYHESLGQHNIGRFRLSTTSQPSGLVTLEGSTLSTAIREVLDTEVAKRTPKQRETLATFYRTQIDNPVLRADREVVALKRKADEFTTNLPSVMVMREGPQRDTFLLVRGQYDKPGEKVGPGLPAVFAPMPADAPKNRLGFARWVVDPGNPLTARVWVNRAWERYFGTGLVRSSENLGTQSDFPSHPELLDWLATEFVRQNWDMKAMHKLIVTSNTYRQSSAVSVVLRDRDPENRLLARGPRFRLPGELVRDQALAIGGVLNPKIGGPPTRPYMPEGVWDETSVYGDLRNYQHDKNANLYRRTMYTVWKRTAAPPTLLLFDAPNREVCVVRRSRTNTPLQALALLNEVTFVEAARKLGERMMREGGSSLEDRLRHGFRLATGRNPKATELKILVEGWQADVELFKKSPDAVGKLLKFGESPAPTDLNQPELAAFTLAGNVLLNLDEVVTRE